MRESEFQNAGKAGGLPDRVQVAFNRIASGQMLSPEMRKDFRRQAAGIYRTHADQYERLAKRFQGIADKSGADADAVSLPLGLPTDAPAPKPAAQRFCVRNAMERRSESIPPTKRRPFVMATRGSANGLEGSSGA